MRVVITGGAGFIGSEVVALLLAHGHNVLVVDDMSSGTPDNLRDSANAYDTTLQLEQLSITDPRVTATILNFKPAVVIHLAAQPSVAISMKNPRLDAEVNVLGLLNILEGAVVARAKKFVFASSGGTIYGRLNAEDLPVTEEHVGRPLSFYGLNKKVALDYLKIFAESYRLPYAALALGNVYGPKQRADGESGVVAIFLDRLLKGEPCFFNGTGATTRDYVYVTDVAEAFHLSTTRGLGLINVGTGVETSVTEVHETIASHFSTGREVIYRQELPGEVPRVVLDPSRAWAELGWRPQAVFRDRIAAMVQARRPGPRHAS